MVDYESNSPASVRGRRDAANQGLTVQAVDDRDLVTAVARAAFQFAHLVDAVDLYPVGPNSDQPAVRCRWYPVVAGILSRFLCRFRRGRYLLHEMHRGQHFAVQAYLAHRLDHTPTAAREKVIGRVTSPGL